jgi:hypothetical protein
MDIKNIKIPLFILKLIYLQFFLMEKILFLVYFVQFAKSLKIKVNWK